MDTFHQLAVILRRWCVASPVPTPSLGFLPINSGYLEELGQLVCSMVRGSMVMVCTFNSQLGPTHIEWLCMRRARCGNPDVWWWTYEKGWTQVTSFNASSSSPPNLAKPSFGYDPDNQALWVWHGTVFHSFALVLLSGLATV